jgi:Putative adhesin
LKKMNALSPLLLLIAAWPVAAQDNWCSDHSFHSDGMVSHSEVRQERLPAAGENVVDPAMNGSIRVHAWTNADIQVKACVQAAAQDASAAAALAKQVTITDGPGRVVAKGPSPVDRSWWSVSYEIWVPASANLQLNANNGSINVEGVAGTIRAHTLNGSLKLKNVTGEVDGESTNGSLSIDLANGDWQGKGLKLNTVNGSIQLHLPETVSADVEASTINGRIRSEFSANVNLEDRHSAKFTLGAGGPKIEARTVNGSVQISRPI